MRTGPKRRGWTPAESAIVGCGSIAVVFVACCIVAVVFARRNAAAGKSSDPAVVRTWLRDEVKADPPKGYECGPSVRFNALGSTVATIVVVPADAKPQEGHDFNPDRTAFLLMRAPMIDQSAPNAKSGAERKVEKTEEVILDVGGRKAKVERRSVVEAGKPRVEYQLALRKGLVFLAVGPKDSFDLKSMEDFLSTMILDQPFDLPTAVKDAGKPNDAKAAGK